MSIGESGVLMGGGRLGMLDCGRHTATDRL